MTQRLLIQESAGHPSFKSLPKEQFFNIKRNTRRLKTSQLLQEQSKPKQSCPLEPQRHLQSRADLSADSKNRYKQLISTFGSEHFLNFRSKPPRRKRPRNLQAKISLSNHVDDDSQSENQRSLNSPDTKTVNSNTAANHYNKIVYERRPFSVDDFLILKKIGEGTYSQVFRAIEKKTGFLCSLKVLNKQKMKALAVQQNLFRQIKINLFLNHPNIFTLYGCFSDKTSVYLIGELATDHSVYDALNIGRINGQRGMPVEVAKNYVGQLCDALKYMHLNMILHRDVKPQNMLITFTTTMKLCDFGWSIYNPDKSLRSTFCGTPLYLAPELVQQETYRQSIDVWAAGVVTYQLLTGQIPFRIRSLRDLNKVVTEQIRYENIQDVTAVDFVSCAMKKKQEERKTIEEICAHPFLKSYHQDKEH